MNIILPQVGTMGKAENGMAHGAMFKRELRTHKA
jgi:hypothetical protein